MQCMHKMEGSPRDSPEQLYKDVKLEFHCWQPCGQDSGAHDDLAAWWSGRIRRIVHLYGVDPS